MKNLKIMDGIKFMILFFWCICMLFFMNNPTLFIIQFILFLIACGYFVYPYLSLTIKIPFQKYYELSKDEKEIWDSISEKMKAGYDEYLNYISKNKDSIICPWSKKLEPNEYNLLNKIHNKFYGNGWYIVDSISGSQASYIMFEDIKDKVK